VPSEFEIIRRYFSRPARNAPLGVGDDAALIRPAAGSELAVSTDLLLEGRHFALRAEPRALGHKALAVNLSDMAAMGATPRWATLALALPAADEGWLAAFAEGFYALAARFAVDLVGGDTTRGPLSICVTILGELPAGSALRRDGARSGDDIWVSGELGGAAFALEHAENPVASKRLHEPEPRVALGERLRGLAHAAIDLSDGFAQDLGHILERSGVGAVVRYADLPKFRIGERALEQRCVLAGGDDYELAFTAPPSARAGIDALPAALGLALTRVGSIEAGPARLRIVDERGAPMGAVRGYDHFAA
jgi:thiamine-monophosphate kinase